MNRRSFIHTSAVAGLATWTQLRAETPSRPRASVHVFSKHLQFLDYEAMAARAAELGFDGVDLTIRPGGHVDPAHADRDLPRAAAALRAAGLDPLMCTTALTAMDQPHADALLDAIADAGFTQLRLGWHRFPRGVPLAQAIDEVRPVARKLAEALQRRGLRGAFQNHAGPGYIGASIWELQQVTADIDPAVIGLQFDIRHATVERGLSWQNEFKLAAPKIASLACKDFQWVADAETGRGRVQDVPFGEGWVNWPAFDSLLEQHEVQAPCSLHFEYDLGGAEHGRRELSAPESRVYDAMRRDLRRLRETLSAWKK